MREGRNIKGRRGSCGMVTGEGAVEEFGEDEKCFFLRREGGWWMVGTQGDCLV